MVTTATDVLPEKQKEKVVNDFAINIATVNGSGSQTANTAIMRALFKMGIPVNGKNLFPSNIKGLPTWYIIRANKDGYVARKETTEIVIAMNPKTVEEDVAGIAPGGVCFHNDGLKFQHRDDVTFYPMPVKQLIKGSSAPPALRNYIVNMVYVGVLTSVLKMDLQEVENALLHHFGGKPKPVALNMEVINTAFEWAEENIVKKDPFYAERMNGTEDMIMIDGNSAAAMGSVYGGVSVVAWYPITPSTSVIDSANAYLSRLRKDPETGKSTYAVIQAEDELAAIGMVIGAGWAGARAMTATSGPGISLMAEYSGLAYIAEVPAVIWDVMRMGPSTGLPTRTSQGDIQFVYNLGHGDSKHVCLFPNGMEETFSFGVAAFDLADLLQTPIFVMIDLDLGMNQWMSKKFEYPQQPMQRGKILDAEALDKIEDYGRYRDVDGDGITYRTLAGTDHEQAAYFSRGTGHNEKALYSERPEDWENNLDRLAKKFETAKTMIPAPVIESMDGAKIGIISYGSSDPATIEARDRLISQGEKVDYLRIRALPLSDEIESFITQHERVYVVENNYSGQMCQILSMELPHVAPKLTALAHCDGLPLTARWIVDALLSKEQK